MPTVSHTSISFSGRVQTFKWLPSELTDHIWHATPFTSKL